MAQNGKLRVSEISNFRS
jgi:hypothetical protein